MLTYRVTQQNDLMQSIIEKLVRGLWKCFKHCSVAKRLPYTMSVFYHFFQHLRMDLLAIQQKSLDRALFLYIFIHEIRSSGVRASITIVHIQKFYKM